MFSSAGRRCLVAVAGASEEAQRARLARAGRRRWGPPRADEWREWGCEKRREREDAAAAEVGMAVSGGAWRRGGEDGTGRWGDD